MNSDRISKTQRWLDLISFLVGRRIPVTRAQIYDHVPAYGRERAEGDTESESLRKKFMRDRDELTELGIGIETVEMRIDGEVGHGYRLASRDFALPYLRLLEVMHPPAPADRPKAPDRSIELHPSDAAVALEGLRALTEHGDFPWRADARTAWRKLAFDLVPAPGQEPPATLLVSSEHDDVAQLVAGLSEALHLRRVCRFTYAAMSSDDLPTRDVEPRGLIYKNNRWYLVAHDRTRNGVRTFRVGRIRGLQFDPSPDAEPDFTIPDDFSMSQWIAAQPWNLPNEDLPLMDVTVRFAFPRAIWAERNGLGELVDRESDGAQLRRFRVRQPDAFVRWLLTFEGEATITEPTGLAASLRTVAQAILASHSPSPEGV